MDWKPITDMNDDEVWPEFWTINLDPAIIDPRADEICQAMIDREIVGTDRFDL